MAFALFYKYISSKRNRPRIEGLLSALTNMLYKLTGTVSGQYQACSPVGQSLQLPQQ
jgi:hypothetical protein